MITFEDVLKHQGKIRGMAINLGLRKEHVDEVIQRVYLTLLEIQDKEGDLNRINYKGDVNLFYIFCIIRSEYYKYQSEKTIQMNEALGYSDEYHYLRERLIDLVHEKLQSQHWYQVSILESILDGYSYHELGRQTGIHFTSLRSAKEKLAKTIRNDSEIKTVFEDYLQEKQHCEEIYQTQSHEQEIYYRNEE